MQNPVYVALANLRFSEKTGNGVCPHRVEELRIEIENGAEIHPIRVNALGDGTYTIKDGRHRVRAYILAGFTEILAVVENTADRIKRLLRKVFGCLIPAMRGFLLKQIAIISNYQFAIFNQFTRNNIYLLNIQYYIVLYVKEMRT
mgnify:FL=1